MSISISGSGAITGASTSYSFDQSVSIAGTVTYEDVTSVDSVGIITAQSGIHVGSGTSINSPGSNILTLGTNNAERLRITSGGNLGIGTANPLERLHLTTTSGNCKLRIDAASAASVDFYNSGTRFSDMFTDASTGNFTITNRQNADIIVRTNGTNERLRVSGVGTVMLRANQGSAETNIIRFEDTDTSTAANQKIGQLQWFSNDASGAGPCVKGEIYVAAQDTTPDGYMVFATHDGSGSTVATERMRISSDGKVGIGSDNPDAFLVVQGDSNDSTAPSIRLKDGSDTREVSITNNSGDFIVYTHGIDNNAHGQIKIFESGIIDFGTGGSGGSIASRIRINGDGGMNVGNGVISSASGDGNIVVDEGIYIGTFNGDNQIRSSSAGSGSSNLFIGNAQIQVSSDRRLKENIVDTVVDASEELKKVRVVDFTWNDPSDQSFNNKNARGTWTGVIAQELVDVFPFAVNAPRKKEDLSIDHESGKTWMLNQDQLVPVLIKGFQQALTRIETLEAEVSELRGN